MTDSYFLGETLDDVMRSAIEKIIEQGTSIHPSKGPCMELAGVMLEISNPRARLSRTETRGRPFSCLGELCWYLAQKNDLDFISYYLPDYSQYADGDILYGGYGPRLFNWKDTDQVRRAIETLKQKPTSRQVVIQLFDAMDLTEKHNDVPCTCVLQLMIRSGLLQMVVYMRSNDVFLGLPHDIFCFTMLQEIMAKSLMIDVGSYKHMVGSLHLYEEDKTRALDFLREGWQPTDMAMQPMPQGEPWPAIRALLAAEASIRSEGEVEIKELGGLDGYWLDLIRLLQIFRYVKDQKLTEARQLRDKMTSNVYNSFIDKKLSN